MVGWKRMDLSGAFHAKFPSVAEKNTVVGSLANERGLSMRSEAGTDDVTTEHQIEVSARTVDQGACNGVFPAEGEWFA